MSYYLHLLRVYIEALKLYLQLSRSFNSPTLQKLTVVVVEIAVKVRVVVIIILVVEIGVVEIGVVEIGVVVVKGIKVIKVIVK
jgi:hypothetical protein